MKLMTNKKLVVFQDLCNKKYWYCGANFFERAYKSDEFIPILYTNNRQLADKVVSMMNNQYNSVD